jgi:hypothetical protein
MSKRDEVTRAEQAAAQKFGQDEQTWPIYIRSSLARLRREARAEEFFTTDDITQRSIEQDSIRTGRTEQDIARMRGLLGNRKQMMVARVQSLTDTGAWIPCEEFHATLDGDITIEDTNPKIRTVITVEWLEQ